MLGITLGASLGIVVTKCSLEGMIRFLEKTKRKTS